MMRSAFSTSACPTWTLDRVAIEARRMRYDAVELRTMGWGVSDLACEPTHTDPGKAARMFDDAGVAIASLATDVRFDDPIRPPILGRALGDHERAVRRGKAFVDLARDLGCPFVRVFAFQKAPRERVRPCIARIAERLFKVVDHSRNSGVRVLLENGGSFPTAESLRPIIDAADLQGLLGVCYCPQSGEGEGVSRALDALGDRIRLVRLRLGGPAGEVSALRGQIDELRRRGYEGTCVIEHDQVWAQSQGDPIASLRDFPAMMLGAAERVA